jgi:IS5 family transposase
VVAITPRQSPTATAATNDGPIERAILEDGSYDKADLVLDGDERLSLNATNFRKCRIHGVSAPARLKGPLTATTAMGYWTREAVEERKFIRSLVKGTLVDTP